jgi:hypothetical protein
MNDGQIGILIVGGICTVVGLAVVYLSRRVSPDRASELEAVIHHPVQRPDADRDPP